MYFNQVNDMLFQKEIENNKGNGNNNDINDNNRNDSDDLNYELNNYIKSSDISERSNLNRIFKYYYNCSQDNFIQIVKKNKEEDKVEKEVNNSQYKNDYNSMIDDDNYNNDRSFSNNSKNNSSNSYNSKQMNLLNKKMQQSQKILDSRNISGMCYNLNCKNIFIKLEECSVCSKIYCFKCIIKCLDCFKSYCENCLLSNNRNIVINNSSDKYTYSNPNAIKNGHEECRTVEDCFL